MGCQTAIARTIHAKGGDYLLSLKGNQTRLHDDIRTFFADAETRAFRDLPHTTAETVDGDHGRIEVRRTWATDDLAWLTARRRWPGLRSGTLTTALTANPIGPTGPPPARSRLARRSRRTVGALRAVGRRRRTDALRAEPGADRVAEDPRAVGAQPLPIEQQYRELKDELGLDHFEGGTYPGWAHHTALTAAALTFLQLERRRSADEPRPTLPAVRAWMREIAAIQYVVGNNQLFSLALSFRRNPPLRR